MIIHPLSLYLDLILTIIQRIIYESSITEKLRHSVHKLSIRHRTSLPSRPQLFQQLLHCVWKWLMTHFLTVKSHEFHHLLLLHHMHFLAKILLSCLLDFLSNSLVDYLSSRFLQLLHSHPLKILRAVLNNILRLIPQDSFNQLIQNLGQFLRQRNLLQIPTRHPLNKYKL